MQNSPLITLRLAAPRSTVLMLRMLILGYVFAIHSDRAICREVQVNLAYRWFCGSSIEDRIPDHSAFTRARNERFRDSDILRRVFLSYHQQCRRRLSRRERLVRRTRPVSGNRFRGVRRPKARKRGRNSGFAAQQKILLYQWLMSWRWAQSPANHSPMRDFPCYPGENTGNFRDSGRLSAR
jgi:hypothetical protein